MCEIKQRIFLSLVLRDLSCVLLDSRFLEQLMNPHPDQGLLTPQQCRILLSDIACCSLMRLDIASMDKLWDLMVMVFKWQMANVKDAQRLLDTTFRHMDGIGRLIPETRKSILIDFAKRHLIEFWDNINETKRDSLLKTVQRWLHPFNVKISILIRLGFQRLDMTFDTECASEHFRYYADNIGENIYVKHANLTSVKLLNDHKSKKKSPNSHELEFLTAQLNVNHATATVAGVGHSISGSSVLDDVLFSVESVPTSARSTLANNENNVDSDDGTESHQFVYVPQGKSTLESILDKFRNESFEERSTESDADAAKDFDVTDELLKMLEED